MPFGVVKILKIKTSSLTDIADTREVLLICLSDQISKFRLRSAPYWNLPSASPLIQKFARRVCKPDSVPAVARHG